MVLQVADTCGSEGIKSRYTTLYSFKGVLKEILTRDTLARFLFEQSGIPEAEFDVFLIEHRLRGNLIDKIAFKDTKPVTKGSYYRSLKQCRVRLKRALFSILLLSYLGMVDLALLNKLLSLISEANLDLRDSDAKMAEFMAILGELATRCIGQKG